MSVAADHQQVGADVGRIVKQRIGRGKPIRYNRPCRRHLQMVAREMFGDVRGWKSVLIAAGARGLDGQHHNLGRLRQHWQGIMDGPGRFACWRPADQGIGADLVEKAGIRDQQQWAAGGHQDVLHQRPGSGGQRIVRIGLPHDDQVGGLDALRYGGDQWAGFEQPITIYTFAPQQFAEPALDDRGLCPALAIYLLGKLRQCPQIWIAAKRECHIRGQQ